MSDETATTATESEGKKHWTKLPENAAKLARVHAARWNKKPAKKTRHQAFCVDCGKVVSSKYNHWRFHPGHTVRSLAATDKTSARPSKKYLRGEGLKPARSIFCITCNRPFSNKYDHFKNFPKHKTKSLNGTDQPPKTNGHRIVSVLGSPVLDKGPRRSLELAAGQQPGFMAGFRAGYDFRAGLESYATDKNISIQTLIASATEVLESEQ